MLPLPRRVAIALGGALLSGLSQLVPRAVHRQLLLTSALMDPLDLSHWMKQLPRGKRRCCESLR